MEVIGQEKLLTFFSGCTLNTLPRTILLVGELGSGRHVVCQEVSKRLSLKYKELGAKITPEIIDELSLGVSPTLCVIDLSKLTTKDENSLLKILEEPPADCYFILLCETKEYVLPTIFNRCFVLHMEPYSKEVLKRFLPIISDKTVLEYAHTPGEVKAWADIDWKEIKKFSNEVIAAIFGGTPQNLLFTVESLECSDALSRKTPLRLFVRVLLTEVRNLMNTPGDTRREFLVYKELSKLASDLLIPHVIKERLICNSFANIKRKIVCR